MAPKKAPTAGIFAVLLSKANFDLSQLSPELREFIYEEVAADRFPLGQIIQRAQSSANDLQALETEFDRIKGTLPEVIDNLPFEFRMLIQPLMHIISR